MQNEDQLILKFESLTFQQLKEIASWSRFLGIFGFVICVLTLLMGCFFPGFVRAVNTSQHDTTMQPGAELILITLYAILAVAYFFPNLFLFQSAKRIKEALESSDQSALDIGFIKLKAALRYWCILSGMFVLFYAFIVLIMFLAPRMAG